MCSNFTILAFLYTVKIQIKKKNHFLKLIQVKENKKMYLYIAYKENVLDNYPVSIIHPFFGTLWTSCF